jgi:thioredoxin 1
MSKVTYTSAVTFQKDVIESTIPVLVDLYADWCGPCRAIAPLLNKLAVEFADRVKIVKVDVDAEKELAARFHVDSIPTLLFFAKGELVHRSAGIMSEASLRNLFKKMESISAPGRLAS